MRPRRLLMVCATGLLALAAYKIVDAIESEDTGQGRAFPIYWNPEARP